MHYTTYLLSNLGVAASLIGYWLYRKISRYFENKRAWKSIEGTNVVVTGAARGTKSPDIRRERERGWRGEWNKRERREREIGVRGERLRGEDEAHVNFSLLKFFRRFGQATRACVCTTAL